MGSFEVSATQITGLLAEVEFRGLKAQVLPRCSPATLAVLANPHVSRWHPGEVVVELSEGVRAVAGEKVVEEINYCMARDAFGPIVRPVVQVAMLLAGRNPNAILRYLPASVQQGMRGTDCTWTSTGARQGTFQVVYPVVLPPTVAFAWRGVLRFVSELAGTPIEVAQVNQHGERVELQLRW